MQDFRVQLAIIEVIVIPFSEAGLQERLQHLVHDLWAADQEITDASIVSGHFPSILDNTSIRQLIGKDNPACMGHQPSHYYIHPIIQIMKGCLQTANVLKLKLLNDKD